MKNLISRQALCEYALNQKDKSITPNDIMRFPSAQPETHEERTETHACDLISRQAAMEINRSYHGQMPNEVNHRIWKEINELPSAQPDLSGYSDKLWKAAYERGKAEALAQLEEAYISGETEAEARFHAQQRWIPCSERLPDEEVLCCDTRGEMIIGYPYPDEESNTGFSAESDDVFMIDCAAWMPLPEPYREEGE